jgi:hypothetical protein
MLWRNCVRGKLPLKLENFVVFFLAVSPHSHRHITPGILPSVTMLKEWDKREYTEGSVNKNNIYLCALFGQCFN